MKSRIYFTFITIKLRISICGVISSALALAMPYPWPSASLLLVCLLLLPISLFNYCCSYGTQQSTQREYRCRTRMHPVTLCASRTHTVIHDHGGPLHAHIHTRDEMYMNTENTIYSIGLTRNVLSTARHPHIHMLSFHSSGSLGLWEHSRRNAAATRRDRRCRRRAGYIAIAIAIVAFVRSLFQVPPKSCAHHAKPVSHAHSHSHSQLESRGLFSL